MPPLVCRGRTPLCQSGKGGVSLSDAVGTNGEGLWLGRVEGALYQALIGAISTGDYHASGEWVRLLERLSII